MDEMEKNDYMNGGGWRDLFSRNKKTTADMVSNEMAELLSNEIEQLKKYIVAPGELNNFFKKIYIKDTTGLVTTSKAKVTPKEAPLVGFTVDPIKPEKKIEEIDDMVRTSIFNNINTTINYDSHELPDEIEIPIKKYKKDDSYKVKVEIESVKISKKDLLIHLANFKIDLDEYLEKVIKNLDRLKQNMLGDRLINLGNFKFFLSELHDTMDCKTINEKITYIKTNGLDKFIKKTETISQKSDGTFKTLNPDTEKKSIDTCIPCNIVINNINEIHNFINNIINEVKNQLLDNNKIVKHFFYDYLIDKLYNKSSSSLISFVKSSNKVLLIHFIYNIYSIYYYYKLNISKYSYKTDTTHILSGCTIFVNSIYDYLNQQEYLKKVYSLMNPNNYQTFCFKTIFNIVFNIETTADNSISRLFGHNYLLQLFADLVSSPIKNYDYVNTIYINGSTNYIDRINKSLGKYTNSSRYELCKINDMSNFSILILYSKLAYYNAKNKINTPIHLTENLFLLVDIGLTLYNIKTRQIIKDLVDGSQYIAPLECELFKEQPPPPSYESVA